MRLEILPSEKFAVISFDRDKCENMPSAGIQLSENCWCTATLPFDLDKIWEADLGSLICAEIRKSQFFIVAKCSSELPEILDHEMEKLKQEVLHVRWGLLLLGIPRSGTQHLMSGAHEGLSPRMRSHSQLEMLHWIQDDEELAINSDQLKKSFILGNARKMLYAIDEKYSRIKRGLHALFRSFEEDEMGSRFHDLVRSVEAVIYPGKGTTKQDFMNRCSSITKAMRDTKKILGEIYDMRSKVEHMHHHFEGVAHYPESKREDIAFLRLRQLDRLARTIYIQILENVSLRDMLETDTTIQALWDDPNAQQHWQRNLDLSTIT